MSSTAQPLITVNSGQKIKEESDHIMPASMVEGLTCEASNISLSEFLILPSSTSHSSETGFSVTTALSMSNSPDMVEAKPFVHTIISSSEETSFTNVLPVPCSLSSHLSSEKLTISSSVLPDDNPALNSVFIPKIEDSGPSFSNIPSFTSNLSLSNSSAGMEGLNCDASNISISELLVSSTAPSNDPDLHVSNLSLSGFLPSPIKASQHSSIPEQNSPPINTQNSFTTRSEFLSPLLPTGCLDTKPSVINPELLTEKSLLGSQNIALLSPKTHSGSSNVCLLSPERNGKNVDISQSAPTELSLSGIFSPEKKQPESLVSTNMDLEASRNDNDNQEMALSRFLESPVKKNENAVAVPLATPSAIFIPKPPPLFGEASQDSIVARLDVTVSIWFYIRYFCAALYQT